MGEEQLAEVRKSSLARIHCDNGDHVKLMQPLAFRKPSQINPLVPCDAITIPQISLYPWKEGYGHHAGYHGAPVHHAAPHHAPVVHHAAPVVHVTPAPHHAPVAHVTASPVAHSVYKPEPVYPQANVYQPAPAPYSPAPASGLQYSAGPTKITPFVHTPLHRFNAAIGK